MKILDARYDLMKGYGNGPVLHVAVDKAELETTNAQLRYRQVEEHGLFLAVAGDWFTGHFHNGSEYDQGGYGGRAFTVTMEDGTEKVLRGPWNGSPECALDEVAMDVTIHHGALDGMGYFGWHLKGESLVTALALADKKLDGDLKNWCGSAVRVTDNGRSYSTICFGKTRWMYPALIYATASAEMSQLKARAARVDNLLDELSRIEYPDTTGR